MLSNIQFVLCFEVTILRGREPKPERTADVVDSQLFEEG